MVIDEQYKKERAAIEQKYHALKSTVWDARPGIISGVTEVEAKVPLEAGDGKRFRLHLLKVMLIFYLL